MPLGGDLGIRLILWMGATLPRPAPPGVLEALQSVEVTSDREKGDGLQLVFNLLKGKTLDYPLLREPLFTPGNRVVVGVAMGIVPQILIDGIITHQEVSAGGDGNVHRHRAGPLVDARPRGEGRAVRQPARFGHRHAHHRRLPAARSRAGSDPHDRRAPPGRANPAPARDRPRLPAAHGRAQRLRVLHRARHPRREHRVLGPREPARPAAAGADERHGRDVEREVPLLRVRRARAGGAAGRVRRPDLQAQHPHPGPALDQGAAARDEPGTGAAHREGQGHRQPATPRAPPRACSPQPRTPRTRSAATARSTRRRTATSCAREGSSACAARACRSTASTSSTP